MNALKTGMGSHKIIVGYESDLLYFVKQNPEVWKSLQAQVKPQIIYPAPTLWSVHTIVTLTPNGKIMMSFLKDPQIQKTAWERYGFRTGIMGVTNDTAAFNVQGISQSIDNVMQLPDYNTMERLLATFQATNQ